MSYKGTVKGNVIERDEPLPFVAGTRVEVAVTPERRPEKNSPEAWLQLVGTLSDEEAGAILRFVQQESRRIDWEIWEQA